MFEQICLKEVWLNFNIKIQRGTKWKNLYKIFFIFLFFTFNCYFILTSLTISYFFIYNN